jgi:GAF domain-containing protein
VKTITVIPITWRGAAIGAIFLRTFRDGPAFSADDLAFCQVVANLTAKALRNAHRFDRMRQRQGEGDAQRRREQEQSALLEFMRRLLAGYPRRGTAEELELGMTGSDEIERLVGVAQAVLSQEVASR